MDHVMLPDDELCYCYHVSLRKLVNFSRRTRPGRSSQMSECLGAGTGCGWCVPFLIRIAEDPERFACDDMTADRYSEARKAYITTKKPRNEF